MPDDFTAQEYHETLALPPQARDAELARGVRALLGSAAVCVPAHNVETDDPTTIGLGDTCVGGFLAAFARQSADQESA